jgi:BirA family transcriptional regulator, biotin operon repressor / biotin---[acetyl-CoA-carboxylase] ligase
MLFRNKAVLRLEAVDSTSNYAANLLKLTPLPEGTVITAQFQVHGRGQRGNVWESDRGANALFSLILYPSFLTAERHFVLNQIISVALKEALEDLVKKDVFIKWPNDLICEGKKIAGILPEVNWSGGKAQSAIIGIGINVNQESFSFPNAISMKNITAKEHDVEDVLNVVLNSTERIYETAFQGTDSILNRYQEYLFRRNEMAQFTLPSTETFHGSILGVDEEGKLIIVDSEGNRRLFGTKELAYVY